ncbi:hypothetical protein PMI28_00345 [Pseudomonas sp. GM48]|nr:hypothetical protein PMI28_00345 [Pseudomonas sp. GM48]
MQKMMDLSFAQGPLRPFSAGHGLQSLLLKSDAIGRQNKYK